MSDRRTEESDALAAAASATGRTTATMALLTFLAFVGIVTLLHFLRPDVSPVQGFISDYASGEYGFLMIAAFLVFALGLGALAIATYRGLPLRPRPRVATFLLSACAVLMALVGIFPGDVAGASTTAGEIHNLATALFFLLLMVAMLVLSVRLRRAGLLGGGYAALLWLALAAPVVAVVAFGLLSAAGVVGIGQRLYVLTLLSWLALLAVGIRNWAFASAE